MASPDPAYSVERVKTLAEEMGPVLHLLKTEPLCVYATGSYGRLEAWDGSDIDLFFLYEPRSPGDTFPWTSMIRLSSCLIEATERMGLPPFSGDGRYLEVMNVDEMERVLGSPQDDSINAFTARMLLLLESRPVYDEDLYTHLVERIVECYYRDFSDHPESFQPVFLVNDILRFWRTLTLNYEHDRLKLTGLANEALEKRKAKSALKNYKLKVSRLATCFSMVANLASEPAPVRPETVLDLCALTPRDRFARLGETRTHDPSITAEMRSIYDEFLESTQRPEPEVLDTFRDPERRAELLGHAASYGRLIYRLLTDVVPEDRMRFLVV